MSFSRTLSLLSHYSADQLFHRCRLRFNQAMLKAFPVSGARYLRGTVSGWPRPDLRREALRRATAHVCRAASAKASMSLEDIEAGTFTFLGRRVSFGSIDTIDWQRDVGDGSNPLWKLNLAYFAYAVPLLSTGDPRALSAIRRMAEGLETQARFDEPGVFGHAWQPYAASHRAINLLAGLSRHLEANPEADASDIDFLCDHVLFCAAYIRRNLEKDIRYNHLLKNFVALSVVASAYDELPRELAFLEHAVPRVLGAQVLEDGGHGERCPMYHAMVLQDVRALRDTGLFAARWHPWLDDVLTRMERALAVMSHPDGDVALFSDSWIGETLPSAALAPLDGLGPDEVLPQTGYARLAGGDMTVILDCGPCGPDDNAGHAHADYLSVEASAHGHRLIVDFGVPTYSEGALRHQSRSSASHNGPRFAGCEPMEFWSSVRVGRRGRAHLLPADGLPEGISHARAAWCDGYMAHEAGAAVLRLVGLHAAGVVIMDVWRGLDHRPALSGFLVDGEWTPRPGPAGGHLFGRDGAEVAILPVIGSLSAVENAAYWPRFGVESRAHHFDMVPIGAGDGIRHAAIWIGDKSGGPGAAELAAFAGRALSRVPARPQSGSKV
jgi:hypothetical protein